jgi:hypothetical protein
MGHEPVRVFGHLIHHLCSSELATRRKLLHSPTDPLDAARVTLHCLLMEQELSGLREEDLGHRLSHGIEFNARSSLSLGPNKYSLDHVPLLTILDQQSRVQDQSLVAHMARTNTVNCSCPSILSRISARL